MRTLLFHHVFFALLCFCAASAFVLPKFVDPARAQIQNIYYPVSRPARLTAQWIRSRFDHQRVVDTASPDVPRGDADIRQENDELRTSNSWLGKQLQLLQEKDAQRLSLGKLGNLCTIFSVTAADSATSSSLQIGGTSLDHLRTGMAAVFPGGMAGRLDTPGLLGTRVQLITDPGFGVIGVFERFGKKADGTRGWFAVSKEQHTARGIGKNTLLVSGVLTTEAAQIEMNDWLILQDPDFTASLQGLRIGRVTKQSEMKKSPGFSEIFIEPATDLMQLHEVMVVTRDK